MNVLIIWNEVPERIFAKKVSMTEAEYEIFRQAHGNLQNLAVNESVETIIEALYSALMPKRHVAEFPVSKYLAHTYAGRWVFDENEEAITDISSCNKLILTGISL